MTQFIAVFCRGAIGIFIKASAKRRQIVKSCLKSNIRDREIPVCSEQVLSLLDAFVA